MADINLEIISPDKKVFADQVDSITIPGTLGSFQVLKNHAPLMSSIEIGVITVKKNGTTLHFSTSGGTVEVLNNKVLLLSDSVENITDIDLNRAEQAKQRAEERLSQKNKEEIDEARAVAALNRAINRINAVQKYN